VYFIGVEMIPYKSKKNFTKKEVATKKLQPPP